MKYAISLGNSKLGRLAIDHLAEGGVAPGDIVAVVRSPAKADDLTLRGVVVRRGEYGDEPSLVEALQGVDKLYMISGMASPEERRRQHRGVIESAKDAGVRCVIYTSFIDTAEDSPFFAWGINRDTETVLKASGLCHTILRNGMDMPLSRIPPCAILARVETGTTGRPAAKAIPWATLAAIRTPVNEPGPQPNAQASSPAFVSPASASNDSIIGRISAACCRGASACRSST